MWFTFARALVAVAALAGCEHRLDLSLALAGDSCTQTVPAGGSILYELSTGGAADGARSFCGGCLAVDATLASPDAIESFLRAHAPTCAGVHPGSTLSVRLTAFAGAGCPDAPAPRIFCSQSPPVGLPDGRDDAVVAVVLTCSAACTGGCVPTTCDALGKNCGMLSDGCSGTLSCGSCTPPLKCGFRGVPNVCAK
jgi:hypothetical protein